MNWQRHPRVGSCTPGRRAVALAATAATALIFAGPGAAPAHAAREVSARYAPGVWVGCDFAQLGAPCLGAVNGIRVLKGETRVRVRISDDNGRLVGGRVSFQDREGYEMAPSVPVCGEALVRLPRGVFQLTVAPPPPLALWSSPHCGAKDASGTGTVVATFT